MRTFYSEYIQHCARFYARHPNPTFRSDVDKWNWIACDRALKGFEQREREIILFVYREGDTIADNIYQVSKRLDIHQDAIWKLIAKFERTVAKRRGLL